MKGELHSFRTYIRNNIVHSTGIDNIHHLGFRITSYSKKDGSRGHSWESPTGKPMFAIEPEEGAMIGVELFLKLVAEYLWAKYPDQMSELDNKK